MRTVRGSPQVFAGGAGRGAGRGALPVKLLCSTPGTPLWLLGGPIVDYLPRVAAKLRARLGSQVEGSFGSFPRLNL